MNRLLIIVLLFAMTASADVPTKHKHHKRTIILLWSAGAAIGLTVALLQRHNCPNFVIYDGKRYPYSGTPPCPPPDWNPTGKPGKR